MHLANDNLLEVFLFLTRRDLDLLHFVNRQFGPLIDDALTHACLRLIENASISFSRDRQSFETKAEVVEWYEVSIDNVRAQRDVRSFGSGSFADAVKHLLLLTCAARVKSLRFKDLEQLDDSFLDYVKTWRGALFNLELYISGCDMSAASEGFLPNLARTFGGSELVYLMSGNKLRPTMISDYFLGELASCGVCWFVEMRPSKERDLRIISDQGILDFFRGTSTRHGRRHLVLDNVQNCSAVVARLLKALDLLERLSAKTVSVRIGPLNKAEVERYTLRLTAVKTSHGIEKYVYNFQCGAAATSTLSYNAFSQWVEICLEAV